ncbi:heavy-metal-associated domain-containing protein [Galenea microaerophila]
MSQIIIVVENIKCGGCANSIQKKLREIAGVSAVEVEIERGAVIVELTDESVIEAVKDALAKMGYPEIGRTEGLSALGAKAKSFISCATGKLDQ